MGGQVNDGYHPILWSRSLCPSSFHPEGTDTPLGCSSLPSPPRLVLPFIKPRSVSTHNPVPLLYLSLAVTLLIAWSPGPEIWWQPISFSPIPCMLTVLPCPLSSSLPLLSFPAPYQILILSLWDFKPISSLVSLAPGLLFWFNLCDGRHQSEMTNLSFALNPALAPYRPATNS